MNWKMMERLAPLLFVLACTACGPALAISPTPDVAPPGTAGTLVPTPSLPLADTPSPGQDIPLAALVNGRPIYLADYERELAQYEADLPLLRGIDPNSPEGQAEMARARVWILDFMVNEELIVQAAERAGVTVSDDVVDAVMQEIVAENGGEEAFKAKLAARGETYEAHREKERRGLIAMAMNQRIIDLVPTEAEHVHARHILVYTREEAERLHAQLEGGADFVALARAYSQDAVTRDTGGDLNWFPRGVLTAPEVEEAAFSLQPGQFSGVVASVLGYHIVQVVERDPARPVSPENLHLLQERALQGWIDGLRVQANIQILVDLES